MDERSLCTDDSFEHIITKYSDMIYRLAIAQTRSKYDADDAFQEVFLRYIRKKPEFQSEEHRKAWFIRVTINCCKSILASPWKKRIVPLASFADTLIFETKEENELFYQLQKLPPEYRVAIHLFYYENMSIDEICNVLEKKTSAVKMQLSRARKRLKEILKDDYYV